VLGPQEVIAVPTEHKEYHLREAALGDLAGILKIERSSFPDPWDARMFQGEFENEYAHMALVFDERSDPPLGFIFYWIVFEETHIMNFAVLPEFRQMGLGRMLLEHCLAHAEQEGCTVIALEVARDNFAAQNLYRRFGFELIGIRRKYYQNGDDALVMAKSL
jgi:ribosomal-protein-alanine N-acetyltransferase